MSANDEQENQTNTIDDLRRAVSRLPSTSGVYRFLDESGTVIYVGKAINLRSRVSSYFNSSRDHSTKVRVMVRHIARLEHIVVDNERDALLLENNLIKEFQPRYNILLKDSKTYPWICITAEHFPRIISTRRHEKGAGEYFGPYASVGTQRVLLELIRSLYPIRSCRLNLSPTAISKGKYAVCLEYHMGNCRGGCAKHETEAQYADYISSAREILKGNFRTAQNQLRDMMTAAATHQKFELAESYKRKLFALDDYRSRSVVVSNHLGTLDVVNLLSIEASHYCNHLKVVDGSVVGCYTFELKGQLDETPAELLSFAIGQLELTAGEIVTPIMPSEDYTDALVVERCFVPQRGDKVRLLELSEKNCKFYRLERLKNIERKDPEKHVERIMEAMRKELALPTQPRHIECFDNSNIGGESAVAACVVFRDGKPYKRDYRHFNIKTVVGSNDFASMKEVVFRRYRRLIDEQAELPQLVVIDGGKGQLGAAVEALVELNLMDRIQLIGLAKRMEEVYYPGDPVPHYFDKKGETLRTIMHLRDEAHRFGITFHRNKRSKKALSN